MTDEKLTQRELQDLVQAVTGSFGMCNCVPGRFICKGHSFLRESDRGLSNRIDKLLWIKRTVQTWQTQEWTGTCSMCGEVGPFMPGSDRCMLCSMARQVEGAGKPFKLPW